MPKRKRDDPQPADDAGKKPRQHSVQLVRAERMVQHGSETLVGAFKLAKGFERQKLSRRLKTAKSNKDQKDETRINAEIEALRTLDLASTASTYLAKSLLKIKAVATSPHLPPSLSTTPKGSTDPAVLNIVARMCKSNPVRNALEPILKEVQDVLGVEKASSGASERKATPKSTPAAETTEASDDGGDEFNGFSDDEAGAKANGDVDGSDMDDDALAAYDDRIGTSSDEEDEPTQSKANIRALLDVYGSQSEGSDVDSEPELSDAEPAKGTVRKRASVSPSRSPSPPPTKRPTTSSFLPTLSSGYISGGSDSDPEAEFDELVGEGTGGQKKNRRGQRARQAIWEKKFGKEAKHIANDKGKRDDGWDAKRGATDGRGGWRGGRGGARGGRGGGAGRGGRQAAPAQAEKVKHRDDGGKLHPSWEAAKKRKDAAQSSGPVKFAGKKIAFD